MKILDDPDMLDMLKQAIDRLETDAKDMTRLTCIVHRRLCCTGRAWEGGVAHDTARLLAEQLNSDGEGAEHVKEVHRNLILEARDCTERWLAENDCQSCD